MSGIQTDRRISGSRVGLDATQRTENCRVPPSPDGERTSLALRTRTINLFLFAALLLMIIAATALGPVRVPFSSVLRAFLHPSQTGDVADIVFGLRLPRVVAAGLVGAALAVTGVLFQGLFRNPLADPFVLGTSGGAALGGAIGIFLIPTLSFAGFGATAVLAFCGSVLTMILVWYLARASGHFAMETLLLAGFAIGTMLNAGTVVFELHEEASNSSLRVLACWLHGQIGSPSWGSLGCWRRSSPWAFWVHCP